MLVEEFQSSLVSPLVLLANFSILEVRTGCHPTVDLSGESLNVVGNRQVGAEILDILGVLILGSEHGHGDGDRLRIIRGEHSGVALHGGFEDLVVLARGQGGDLSTPAVAQDRPGLELAVGGKLVGFRYNAWDLRKSAWGSGLGLEEVAELLLVVIVLGREPGDVGGLAFEKVGHEDPVLLLIGSGKDVGTLDGLVEETEDVCRRFLAICVRGLDDV